MLAYNNFISEMMLEKKIKMKTPQEKQIEAYVETIAELNREVARLSRENKTLIKKYEGLKESIKRMGYHLSK